MEFRSERYGMRFVCFSDIELPNHFSIWIKHHDVVSPSDENVMRLGIHCEVVPSAISAQNDLLYWAALEFCAQTRVEAVRAAMVFTAKNSSANRSERLILIENTPPQLGS